MFRTFLALAVLSMMVPMAGLPMTTPGRGLTTPGADVIFEGDPSFSSSLYVSGGDGSSSSPYTIDDLDMQGHNIQIKNTTAYVHLRNITFSQSNRHAIYLYNAENLIMDNITSLNRSRFIRGESVDQMLLSRSSINDIPGAQNVVEFVSSSFITIDNCSFSMLSGQQGAKIYFNDQGANHVLRGLNLTRVGIEDRRFINNDRIEGCSIDGEGVLVDNTQAGALIKDNMMIRSGGNAITIRASNRVVIEGNHIEAANGIYFEDSPLLSDTSVKGRIEHNTFESCIYGINSNPNWQNSRVSQYHVNNNYFGNCSSWAIHWQWGISNTVWHNIFYHNAATQDSGSAPQVSQGWQYGGSNQWTNNDMGNFWQNHRTPDDDNDGIVDTPYTLANGGVDSDPYTNRYFDTTRPTLVLLSPSGDYAPHTYTVLRYRAEDVGSGIDRIEMSLNGGPWKTLPDPTSTSVIMNKGANSISLRCFDRAGLYAVVDRVLTLNVSSDPLSFQYPAEGSYVKTSPLQISWTTPSGLLPVNQTVIMDGVSQDVQPTSRFITASLGEGPHRVTLLVKDEWGRTFNRSVNFTVDLTPPTLEILSPQSGAVISNPIVGFRIQAEDNFAIASMSAVLDGVEWETFSMGQTNIRAISPGSHDFMVTLTDLAGWTVVQEIDFELVTEEEFNGLFFENPAPPIGYTRDAAYGIAWNYTGSFQWHRTFLRTERSGSFIDIGDNRHVQIELPEDKSYELTLRLEDQYQNYVEASSILVKDTVPPKVIISGIQEGSRTNVENVELTWTALDSSPIERYEYSIDGSPFIDAGSDNRAMIEPGEGDHTVTIRAIDMAGNIGEAMRSFTIDTTPNLAWITSPGNGSYHSESRIVISWGIQDIDDVLNITLKVGDNDVLDVTGKVNIDVLIREEGLLTIALSCVDLAGNIHNDSIVIIVDRQPPIVRWVKEPPRYTNLNWVNITYEVLDNYGIRSIYLHINDNSTEIQDYKGFFNITDIPEGIYNVSIRAVDRSGKETHPEPFQIIVDRTSPYLVIDMTSTRVADRIAAVFWIARDSGSGISHSELSIDEATWQDLGTLNTYTTGALPFGDHNITVRVWDRAGNSAEETWVFTVGGGPQNIDNGEEGSFPWCIVPLIAVILLVVLFVAFVAWRRSRMKRDERPTRVAPRKLSLGYSPPVTVGRVQTPTPDTGSVKEQKVESTEEGTGYIRPKAKEKAKKKAQVIQYDTEESQVISNGSRPDEVSAEWFSEKQRVLKEEAKSVFVGQQPIDIQDGVAYDDGAPTMDRYESPSNEETEVHPIEEGPIVDETSIEEDEEVEFDDDVPEEEIPELIEFDEE
ncbi:MAG: hypothetical protein QCI82_06595 [Candidatus Thermoplasmatota archaeon]|nr:hypothetical protein [Candidatus Thermoplasmatota archaeon]